MAEIFYEAANDGTSEPKIYKVIDLDGNVDNYILTSVPLQNTDELEKISDDIIWQHIENLTSYMASLFGTLSITPLGSYPSNGWPVVGWYEIDMLNSRINEWWYFLSRREKVPA